MRIVTRPDFDGIVCAMLIRAAEPIDQPIKWAAPNDMQKGRVAITADDIIALKNAGLSNDVIQAIIRVVGDSTDAERRDAYRLLEGMQIRVDLRDGD